MTVKHAVITNDELMKSTVGEVGANAKTFEKAVDIYPKYMGKDDSWHRIH